MKNILGLLILPLAMVLVVICLIILQAQVAGQIIKDLCTNNLM